MQNETNSEEDHKSAPKWRRKPESRPDEILDGALIEFRSRGFAGARIEDIAKHAGLSKGTVYLYFSSKEEMLKALVRRSVLPISEMFTDIAGHVQDNNKKAADVLSQMIQIAANKFSNHEIGSIPLLIIGEAGNFPELAEFYRQEVIEASMKAIMTVLMFGIQKGEFRKCNPKYAVRTLMGALLMQVIWDGTFARDDEEPISYEELIQSHLDIFMNGILLPQENS
ncbi:MAG: TetR/AcrR family transcriptional regulator [Kordiimonadaceae bacterium]|jgi:AcrR family transcriptional regulator|nr:TetR/AcrR family transcriptional regulator [Kordiimonadaceae bacterium]MBT6032207.1 TetR/AcrR family transcriptional regulator [Kordiimonadaceae bacterium]